MSLVKIASTTATVSDAQLERFLVSRQRFRAESMAMDANSECPWKTLFDCGSLGMLLILERRGSNCIKFRWFDRPTSIEVPPNGFPTDREISDLVPEEGLPFDQIPKFIDDLRNRIRSMVEVADVQWRARKSKGR